MKAESKTKTIVAEVSEEEVQKKGKVEKKAGKRVGFNYIIVKSLKEHRKNDVVKCLYIKSFTDFGFCVIKEGTEGDTKDKAGRDIQDRLKWQKELHEQLQGKVDLPKYYGSFEENGNYYLVIELIRGRSLGSMIRKAGRKLRDELNNGGKSGNKFLGYFIQIINLLDALHKEGVVHRDASSGNFVINRWGKVRVIDMELSYSVFKEFPNPAFELGTNGYMSPQQEMMQTPTIHEDIFAAGAIALQMWTGVSPSKLTRTTAAEMIERVRFFIPDTKLSEVVIKCLHPEVEKRGSLSELRDVIVQYKKDLKRKQARINNKLQTISADQVMETLQSGIKSICSPLMADPEKGWFAQNQATANEDRSKIDKEYYGSFQFGVAGVIYFIGKVARVGLEIDLAKLHIESGLRVIESKYIARKVSSSPGLYFGASGVAAVLHSVQQDGLISNVQFKDWINIFLQRFNDEQTFLNGRSGQSIGIVYCISQLDGWDVAGRLANNFQLIRETQNSDGSWITFKGGKNSKEKISSGIVYGMSGFILFLLEYFKTSNDSEVLRTAEAGLSYLMRKRAIRHKNTIEWRSSSKRTLDYAWCAGSSGIAHTFFKAWEVTGNPLYKAYAENSLRAIDKNIVDGELSQFNGLSGLGEVYLDAFKLTGNEEWRERARWLVQILQNMRSVHSKHGLYWNVGHEKNPIAGFMTGNSGVLHFLLRYLFPDQISFPLLSGDNYTKNASSIIELEPASIIQLH